MRVRYAAVRLTEKISRKGRSVNMAYITVILKVGRLLVRAVMLADRLKSIRSWLLGFSYGVSSRPK